MKLLKTVIYVFIAILFTHQTNAQNKNRLKSRVAFVSYSIQKNTRGESSLNFLDKKTGDRLSASYIITYSRHVYSLIVRCFQCLYIVWQKKCLTFLFFKDTKCV